MGTVPRGGLVGGRQGMANFPPEQDLRNSNHDAEEGFEPSSDVKASEADGCSWVCERTMKYILACCSS
jgi:hypothetical protein